MYVKLCAQKDVQLVSVMIKLSQDERKPESMEQTTSIRQHTCELPHVTCGYASISGRQMCINKQQTAQTAT